jgi:hypothetical protein
MNMTTRDYSQLIDKYNQWQNGRFNMNAEDYNELAASILRSIDKNNISIDKLRRAAKTRTMWKIATDTAA